MGENVVVVTEKKPLSCFAIGCLGILGLIALVFLLPIVLSPFTEGKKEKLFAADREEILQEIQSALDEEDFELAFKTALPYVGVDDFEFRKLWAKIETGRDKEREARMAESQNETSGMDLIGDALVERIRGNGQEQGQSEEKESGNALVDGMKFIVNEVNKAEEQKNLSFQKDKDKILSSINAAIEQGDFDLAFRLAEPYADVDDFEFRQLWAKISAHRQKDNR